jgi:hypothetical protein
MMERKSDALREHWSALDEEVLRIMRDLPPSKVDATGALIRETRDAHRKYIEALAERQAHADPQRCPRSYLDRVRQTRAAAGGTGGTGWLASPEDPGDTCCRRASSSVRPLPVAVMERKGWGSN